SSRKRLTWRTLRAVSDMPFLAVSSSSSTAAGSTTSCSSKRNSAVGSCISTLVSSKYRRLPGRGYLAMPALLTPNRGEHFSRMVGDLDPAPFAAQHAVAVDQEGTALDTEHFAA